MLFYLLLLVGGIKGKSIILGGKCIADGMIKFPVFFSLSFVCSSILLFFNDKCPRFVLLSLTTKDEQSYLLK